MHGMTESIIGVLLIGLGAMIAWIAQSNRFERRMHDLKQAMDQYKQKSDKLTVERDMMHTQITDLKATLDKTQPEVIRLQSELSAKTVEQEHLNQKLSDQSNEMNLLHQKFTSDFERIATKVLDENVGKFSRQHQTQLDGVLKPFNEKLNEFKKKVDDTYQHEARQRASLQGEIKQLFELNQTMAKEAKNLTTALKGGSKTQGNWGELILELLLERSGLKKGVEFTTQGAFQTEDGKRQYPDVILNLPNNKHMVIDSKVSLVAYEAYFSEESEAAKAVALKHHVTSVRTHIKQLSQKNYQHLYDINSPDFVLMFMPIEPAFGLAVQQDSSLFYEALDLRVVMVSPSTLLTTLQIIANIWKQDRQNKHTLEIARQGGALYDKFVGLVDELQTLGKQLNTTGRTYDGVMKKLTSGKGNLISQTEKLKVLGANAKKSLHPAVLDGAMQSDQPTHVGAVEEPLLIR